MRADSETLDGGGRAGGYCIASIPLLATAGG